MQLGVINLLRGVSALWVLISHCMIWGGKYYSIIPSPKIAVDVFILISGYIISYAYFDKFKTLSFSKYLSFGITRFFRIAPIYYISLFICVIISEHFLLGYKQFQLLNPEKWTYFVYDPTRIVYNIENILLHITFLFGLHPSYSFSTFLPDWSLSLEVQFYCFFPFLVPLLVRFPFITILIISILSLISNSIISNTYQFYEPSFLFFKIHIFFAGILCFLSISYINKKLMSYLYLVISIIFASNFTFIYSHPHHTIVPLTVILIFLNLNPNILILKRFNFLLSRNKIIMFLSEVSYSVYLIHGFMISLFGLIFIKSDVISSYDSELITLLLILFVTLSTYILSFYSHKYIELYFMNKGRVLSNLIK